MTAQPKITPRAHSFNPTILREYDIRGQVDKNLNEEDAYALGLAYGTYVRRENNGAFCSEAPQGGGRHHGDRVA